MVNVLLYNLSFSKNSYKISTINVIILFKFVRKKEEIKSENRGVGTGWAGWEADIIRFSNP